MEPKLLIVISLASLFAAVAVGSSGCGFLSPAAGPTINASAPGEVSATPLPSPTSTRAESPLPPPTGFVNDFANVIDDPTKLQLEKRLAELKKRSNVEFAVATVKTSGNRGIDDYSLAVARGWGIGPKNSKEGGGVLLLVAVEDRRWRIQVSRSLEADIPNETVSEIGERMSVPFQEGRYGEGIVKCVGDLIDEISKKKR